MAKILILEDDIIAALDLSSLLTDANHTVSIASGEEEAKRLGNSFNPDILISDWNLTGQTNGYELALHFSKTNPLLKVIFVSGTSKDQIIKACGDLASRGAVLGIFVKPCDYSEIVRLVAKHIGPFA